ncbi:hypothetical protein KKB99_02065 [bacterium]|nr:hypothetical protein [bacterium]MBU1024772.1 hypothetical protein [bacterium]
MMERQIIACAQLRSVTLIKRGDKKGAVPLPAVNRSIKCTRPLFRTRDRLVEERYLKYNSTTERMDVYRAREYTYDASGNMTKKMIIEDGDWIEYTLTYSKGAHITDWDNTVSSGSVNSNLTPTYDANGNMTRLPAVTVSGGGPSQFDLLQMEFTYDRKNRLATYNINQGDIRTLKWDALGRIREKTWTVSSVNYKQIFYHDGRTLMQIWDETVAGAVVSRTLAYDLYVGETGYLKDIDFNSDPDEEGYLVKDAQGSVRAIVNVTYSGGAYSVTTERYNTDGYGAWLDFDAAHSNGTHYMRYISSRVEDYCNSGSTNDNQALYHTDHRHYLPFLGIFLQREPLLVWPSKRSLRLSANSANLNPYRYAENSPVDLFDRSGLAVGGCCGEPLTGPTAPIPMQAGTPGGGAEILPESPPGSDELDDCLEAEADIVGNYILSPNPHWLYWGIAGNQLPQTFPEWVDRCHLICVGLANRYFGEGYVPGKEDFYIACRNTCEDWWEAWGSGPIDANTALNLAIPMLLEIVRESREYIQAGFCHSILQCLLNNGGIPGGPTGHDSPQAIAFLDCCTAPINEEFLSSATRAILFNCLTEALKA